MCHNLPCGCMVVPCRCTSTSPLLYIIIDLHTAWTGYVRPGAYGQHVDKYCKAPDTSSGAPGLGASEASMLACYKHITPNMQHLLGLQMRLQTHQVLDTATEKERPLMRQDDIVFLCVRALWLSAFS